VCVCVLTGFVSLKSRVRTVTFAHCMSDSEANEPGDSSLVKTLGIRGRTIGRGVGRFIFQTKIDFSFGLILVTSIFCSRKKNP